MSRLHVTYAVVGLCAVLGLAGFVSLILRAGLGDLSARLGARRRDRPLLLRARRDDGARARRCDRLLLDLGTTAVVRSAPETAGLSELAALEEISAAVQAGAGLPAVVRAASRALEASIAVLDRGGHALAVAARSPSDEQSLLLEAEGVRTIDLRLGEHSVGRLRLRARGEYRGELLALVTTLIASEVERVRAPERASEEAASEFLRVVARTGAGTCEELIAQAREAGLRELERGGACSSCTRARRRPRRRAGARGCARSRRGRRAPLAGAVAALSERESGPGPRSSCCCRRRRARRRGARRRRAAGPRGRLCGFGFASGGRGAGDPLELARAADEALLAANVAVGDGRAASWRSRRLAPTACCSAR